MERNNDKFKISLPILKTSGEIRAENFSGTIYRMQAGRAEMGTGSLPQP